MGEGKIETGAGKDINSGTESQQGGATQTQQGQADAQRDLGNLKTTIETQQDLGKLQDETGS